MVTRLKNILITATITPIIVVCLIMWRVYVKIINKLYETLPKIGQVIAQWTNSIHADSNRRNVMITIPYSHFCEKVRWAFAASGEPLEEMGCAPLFHLKTLYHLGNNYGGRGTVPTLITADKTVLAESSDCLRYLADVNGRRHKKDWLFPNAEIEKFDRKISLGSKSYGHHAFRVVYYYLFNDEIGRQSLYKAWLQNIPAWQALCVPLIWPVCEWMMGAQMKLHDENTFKENMKAVDEVWDEVGNMLSDGREFLFGTADISAADIGFAAISYPLILPPEMNKWFLPYDKDVLPLKYCEEVQRRRNTATGRYILRLYRQHRHKVI